MTFWLVGSQRAGLFSTTFGFRIGLFRLSDSFLGRKIILISLMLLQFLMLLVVVSFFGINLNFVVSGKLLGYSMTISADA